MLDQRIADYIKSQLQLGASKDAVRDALIGAGWPKPDVEEAMKSFSEVQKASSQDYVVPKESAKVSAPAQAEFSSTIAVSDLVANSDLKPFSISSKREEKSKPADISVPSAQPLAESVKSGPEALLGKILSKRWITIESLGILVVALVAFSVYLYFGTAKLKGEVVALTEAGKETASQLNAANSKVEELKGANGALQAQALTFAREVSALKTELSFFVTLPSVGTSTSQVEVVVSGILSGGGKIPYIVTLEDGVRVFVKNFKDEKVSAELEPLKGGAMEIRGTHVPGSPDIDVVAVNGKEL